MRTATIRQLRNDFAQIAKWLQNGESVLLMSRKKIVGKIIPEPQEKRTLKMPDFAARIASEYPHHRISAKKSEILRNDLRGNR